MSAFSPTFSQQKKETTLIGDGGAKLKSCVIGPGNGFPFWRRVCLDCKIHFISGNGGRSTCWK